jgi:hypothetical protein
MIVQDLPFHSSASVASESSSESLEPTAMHRFTEVHDTPERESYSMPEMLRVLDTVHCVPLDTSARVLPGRPV